MLDAVLAVAPVWVRGMGWYSTSPNASRLAFLAAFAMLILFTMPIVFTD